MNVKVSTLSAIRFGYGFRPDAPPPANAGDLMAQLRGPDHITTELPIANFQVRVQERRALGRLKRAAKTGDSEAVAAEKKARQKAGRGIQKDFVTTLLRPIVSPDGFRERLVQFWADHFTIVAKGKGLRFLVSSYIEDIIRPGITGRFSDLLRGAATHPVMMTYLDQIISVGPNSPFGIEKGRGLNENLAREILELHTLGVHGGYTQGDVRQFAELLTGLHFNRKTGFRFLPKLAEPGAETVLGHSYGSDAPATLDDIYAVLDDLATHPDTARHLSQKLAVHFISDDPDPGLVNHMAGVFAASDGDLLATYAAMLEHPAAWEGFGDKAKQPFDYMVSALRALGVDIELIKALPTRSKRLYLSAPLLVMGQPYHRPGGPDGWPEAAQDWITPQGLAARIQWAMAIINALGQERDPQDFARSALGDAAGSRLLQALGGSESRLEGMALVLASPAFNRR